MSDSDKYIVHKVRKYSAGKVVGTRIIEEPVLELKAIQRKLIKQLAEAVDFPSYINGVARTSIVSNSTPHINKSILYKIDLKDFFHTVTLDKICREPFSQELINSIELNCMYNNRLPTGAPTSPILANIAFLSTDRKIVSLLNNNIQYTRYMDDLCFSSLKLEDLPPDLINKIISTIKSDGWIINNKKSGLSLNFKRQTVTGIVVNNKLNISRDRKLLLRSKLDHQARISNKLTSELQGELAHVRNIRSDLYRSFIQYFKKRVSFYEGTKTIS